MSIDNSAPLTEEDFERLDRFLLSDAVPETCMTIDEVDGFFTGLLCGPEAILPGEWFPVLWGGDPDFSSKQESEEILGLLMRMYNEIALSLHEGFDICPLLMEEEDDLGKTVVHPEGWCFGFLKALSLREHAWREHADERLNELLAPLLALGTIEEAEEKNSDVGLPEVKERLSDMIPASVAGIREFWRKKGYAAMEPARTSLPTENEICPCGSGKPAPMCCMGNKRVLH